MKNTRWMGLLVSGLLLGGAAQANMVDMKAGAKRVGSTEVVDTQSSPGTSDVSASVWGENVEYGESSASASVLTNGSYGVSASGNGLLGESSAMAGFKYFFTNTTGMAQQFEAKFKIFGGALETVVEEGALVEDAEKQRAGYKALLSVNGVNQFSSAAELTRNALGLSFSSSGSALSGDAWTDGVFSWGEQTITINLGLLGVGESVTIDALVESWILNEVWSSETCPSCYTAASFSDPFGVAGITVNAVTPGGTVPEPTPLALLGAGLLAAGLARRARRVN